MGKDAMAAAQQPKQGPPLSELGARIRQLRHTRSLSLAELSERAQVSVAMLSHIERGQTAPSLKTLDRVRAALEVSLADLFPSGEVKGAGPPVVVRDHERPRLELKSIGLVKELLSPGRASDMELLMLVLAPGGSSGIEPWMRNGEKAGLVIEGRFELRIGEAVHELEAGDAFQFDSSIPHRFRNLARCETRVLWIVKSNAAG